MSTRLHIVVSEELLARIDGALGVGQPRADFIRRAVERALGEPDSGVAVGRNLAPAEQPETWREALADRSAGANPARREFTPYPKGGKR